MVTWSIPPGIKLLPAVGQKKCVGWISITLAVANYPSKQRKVRTIILQNYVHLYDIKKEIVADGVT